MILKLENETLSLFLSKDKIQIYSKKNGVLFGEFDRTRCKLYTKVTKISDLYSFYKLNTSIGKDNYYSLELYFDIFDYPNATGYYEIIDFDSNLEHLIPYLSDNGTNAIIDDDVHFGYKNGREIKFDNINKVFFRFDGNENNKDLVLSCTHNIFFRKSKARVTCFEQNYLYLSNIIYQNRFAKKLYQKNLKRLFSFLLPNIIITLTTYIFFQMFSNKMSVFLFYVIAILLNHTREVGLLNEAKKDYYLNLFMPKNAMYKYQVLLQMSFFICY